MYIYSRSLQDAYNFLHFFFFCLYNRKIKVMELEMDTMEKKGKIGSTPTENGVIKEDDKI